MDDAEQHTTHDLVSLAYDQKPVDFQGVFNDILTDKVTQAIYDKKVEMAKTMFAGPDDYSDDDDDSAEIEDELDFEDDEEDLSLDQEEEQDGETA